MLQELKAPAQDCPGGQQQSQESGLLLGAQGLITLGDVREGKGGREGERQLVASHPPPPG